MKNANDQNFFNFVGGLRQRGFRQRVIRYIKVDIVRISPENSTNKFNICNI